MAVDEVKAVTAVPVPAKPPWDGSARTAAAILATRLARVHVGVWLVGLVVVSAGYRYLAARATVAPSIFPDELIYFDLARSFADSGSFTVLGIHFAPWSYGPLYPVLVAPALVVVHGTQAAYAAVKLIDCIVVSVAAVPAYLLARRMLERHLAFVFAATALLVPSLVYSTKVMTESLAYPVFLWAVLAMQRAIERPAARRQVEALAVIGLAILSRAQMIVLLPAFVGAIAAVGVLDSLDADRPKQSWRPWLRRYRLTWWALGGLLVVALVSLAAAPGRVLGLHTTLRPQEELVAGPRWLVYHVAELDLSAGVVPLVAFLLLLLVVRELPRALRVFMATATSVAVWLLVLVAIYATASARTPFIHERYLFYLVPLFVLGMFAWLRQGLPRPRGMRLVVAVVTLLPLAIPFRDVLVPRRWGVNSATVGLVPWGLARMASDSLVPVYVGTIVMVAGCALLVLTVRSRTAGRLILAVACYFLVVGAVVDVASLEVTDASARAAVARSDPAWIDRTVGPRAEVAVLWSGGPGAGWRGGFAVWENAFFNRSVRNVYTVRGDFPEQWASTRLTLQGTLATAGGKPVTPRYVLADPTMQVRGTVLGHDLCTGMTLYRVRGPLHVRLVPSGARQQQPQACQSEQS